MRYLHEMPFGAHYREGRGTRFRLWAPAARSVRLRADVPDTGALELDLHRGADGWFELQAPELGPGTRYLYRIDDEIDVPDPAARFNPQGVHAPSVVIDPHTFQWTSTSWRGRQWHEAVIYEAHVGTFSANGAYDGMLERLDELAALGVTVLELLPLACFGGQRGWGYDGVLLFAPHAAYGAPEDLKRLIDAAHARELCVVLDVVYNHFGPDGNYLSRYAPQFFTSRHRTPWGDAIDFAHPIVRQFFIENALYWLNEYRLDGLRIDAVHAMHDDTERHFIDELIDTVQEGPGRERRIHVILENHKNEARRLRRPYVSQWNDDFHHPLHILLTAERDGYYVDYAQRPIEQLGRVLAEGFAFQGEISEHAGEPRGERSAHLPPQALVNFLQNHDQIGNRAFGERLAQLTQEAPLRAALAVLLLAPQIPMLFMGEEYAAPQPFLYFCDYEGDLANAVREGRRAEFESFSAFKDPSVRERIPDPNAFSTFEQSRLDWTQRSLPPHARCLSYVRELLRLRRERIVETVPQIVPGEATYEVHDSILRVRWPLREGGALQMLANLGPSSASSPAASWTQLWFSSSELDAQTLPGWSVCVGVSA